MKLSDADQPVQHYIAQYSVSGSKCLFLFGNWKRCRIRRSKDDYRSPRRSRSISRSLSPRDERGYRSDQRSPSPRENGGSPHDERDYALSRSRSPRGNSHSLSRSRSRSGSPR
ncbi:hypothetical protein ACOSQ4_006974 [Xanthoceras sorbifolium]